MDDLPEILYKYRDWKNPIHKLTITHGEFYLAPPKSFPDKYDCNIPLDFGSLTDKQIQRRYFELSHIENPGYNRKKHREFARSWTRKRLLRDEARCRQIEAEFFDKFNDQTGVLSLTANNSNSKLWEKYAADNTGFCIGFESQIVLDNLEAFGSCGPVEYKKDFPSISPFITDRNDKTWITQVYTKLLKWEYEEEYRVFKMRSHILSEGERKIRIPLESITSIILGAHITELNKNGIIEVLNNGNYPNATLYQATIDQDIIRVSIIKMDEI